MIGHWHWCVFVFHSPSVIIFNYILQIHAISISIPINCYGFSSAVFLVYFIHLEYSIMVVFIKCFPMPFLARKHWTIEIVEKYILFFGNAFPAGAEPTVLHVQLL